MKAILVIDMPKSCRECRLYRPYEYRQAVHCAGNFRNINFSDSETDKPSWCPLRPLPQKFRTDGDDIEEDSYWNGWNDCIDEITGETE